jgi:hypothetical protein
MRKLTSFKTGTIVFGVLLSFLFIFGCSELPNKPNGGEFGIADYEFLLESSKSADPMEPETPAPPSDNNITVVSGGKVFIEIDRKSTAEFDVPPYAVASDVQITAHVSKTKVRSKAVLDFTFGPSGLVFTSAATLRIDAKAFEDSDMTCVYWYWFNPSTGKWELEHVVDVKNGKVEIPVSHFSRYVGISQGGQQ